MFRLVVIFLWVMLMPSNHLACAKRHHQRACSAPVVSLISPYKIPDVGWTVHGSIAFAVDVHDFVSISKVDFYVNGELIFSDRDYPWGLLWKTRELEPTSYTLKAVATNSCGAYTAISQTVNVAAPLTKASAEGTVVTSGLLPDIQPAIEDINLRDTSVTVGPDNVYYLSGTGADNDAWHHNEGINLWKSDDLKTWTYVGLIWSFERDGYDDEKTWWYYKETQRFRAVWAPEIQYLHGSFYITYSLQWKGSKLLVSTTGLPQGPYALAAGEEVNLFNNIDGSLFADDKNSKIGYLCYESGTIFELNSSWNATTGSPTRINAGDEGCFVFHWRAKYYMSVALFMSNGRYSSWVGLSDGPTGPFTSFHEALPCGGHNSYFIDKCGNLWGTFFGNDVQAPWREKPAIVRMATNANGTLYLHKNQAVPTC